MKGGLNPIPDLMPIADNIHDYFKERGNANLDIRDELNKVMPPNVTEFIKQLSENYITSPSNIEPQTERYIEQKYNLPSDGFNLTYKEIMNDFSIPGNPLSNSVAEAYGLQDVLIISGIDESGVDLTKDSPERNYIANFILKFFNPEYTNEDVGFIFDASSGKLPYIFFNIDQCETCKTALTIADSAPTSVDDVEDIKKKKKKSEKSLSKLNKSSFIFPPTVDGEYLYTITSNYWMPDLILTYSSPNRLFSKNNPYDLRLNIQAGDNIFSIDFNVKNNQGASVNQLKELIKYISNVNQVENAKDTLDIKQLVISLKKLGISNIDIIKFLLDYKRSGDYEQVNCVELIRQNYGLTIFSSIDILCVLYARLQSMNCIRTQGGNLYLYRFPGMLIEPTPDLLLKKKYLQLNIKCKQLVNIINLIKSTLGSSKFINFFNDQDKFFTETIESSMQRQSLNYEFTNLLLSIQMIGIKNKFISILGENSLLGDFNNSIIDFFQINEFFTNQIQINTVLDQTNPYDALINFLINFTQANFEDLKKSRRLFDIDNQIIYYEIQPLDGSPGILIDLDKLIDFFGLNLINNYKEILNTIDKIYNEKTGDFSARSVTLLKMDKKLINNRVINFPYFSTKIYSIIECSYQEHNRNINNFLEGKRERSVDIFKSNLDIFTENLIELLEEIEILFPDLFLENNILDSVNFRELILPDSQAIDYSDYKENFNKNFIQFTENIKNILEFINPPTPEIMEEETSIPFDDSSASSISSPLSDISTPQSNTESPLTIPDYDTLPITTGVNQFSALRDSDSESDTSPVSTTSLRRSKRIRGDSPLTIPDYDTLPITTGVNQFSALRDSDSESDTSPVSTTSLRRSKRIMGETPLSGGANGKRSQEEISEIDAFSPTNILVNNPEFYFEINELFNSTTSPLREIVDSFYGINNKSENIMNILKNIQNKINIIVKKNSIYSLKLHY